MNQESVLSEGKISSFAEELIKVWRSKENDEEHYKKFISLPKEQLIKIIDLLIEEIEEIKAVNKLIRLKESLNSVFDLKLLYNNLKITIINHY